MRFISISAFLMLLVLASNSLAESNRLRQFTFPGFGKIRPQPVESTLLVAKSSHGGSFSLRDDSGDLLSGNILNKFKNEKNSSLIQDSGQGHVIEKVVGRKMGKDWSGLIFDRSGLRYKDPVTGSQYDLFINVRSGLLVLQDSVSKELSRPSNNLIETVRNYYDSTIAEPDEYGVISVFLTWSERVLSGDVYGMEDTRPSIGGALMANNQLDMNSLRWIASDALDKEIEGMVKLSPLFPWESDFIDFILKSDSFEIRTEPLQEELPDSDLGPVNIIQQPTTYASERFYIVEGTNNTSNNSFRQYFMNLGVGVELCSFVDPSFEVEGCIDRLVKTRMQRFMKSKDDARKAIDLVIAGPGVDGAGGGLLQKGMGRPFNLDDNSRYSMLPRDTFFGRMIRKGYEFSSVTIYSSDPGNVFSEEQAVQIGKYFAMLPGNPTVQIYDGRVVAVQNFVAVDAGHNEITVKLKPSLTYDVAISSLDDGAGFRRWVIY